MLRKTCYSLLILFTLQTARAQVNTSVDSLYLKGIELKSNKQYQQAICAWDTVLQIQPGHREARLSRAYLYFLMSNYKPSREDLDYLLNTDKNDTQALFNRALFFFERGEYGLAIRDIKGYIELKPEDPEGWYYKGHIQKDAALYNDAIKSLDNAIALAGGSHYKSFVVKGNIYSTKNKKDNAIEQYGLAMKADSTQGLPYVNRGRVFLSRNDTAAAMKDFDKAVAVNPGDEYTITSVNKQLIKMGAIEKAAVQFDTWIQKDPASINGWMGKGYLQAYKENYAEALQSFGKVLTFYPGYADALFFHGVMLMETGDKKNGREEIKKAADMGYPPAKQFQARTWKLVGGILSRLIAATATTR